jgi:hypothetical protein
MQEAAVLVATIAALSLTCTKVVDFFRNAFDKQDEAPKWTWNVVALVVGLAFALGWSVNVATEATKLIPALADQADRLAGLSGEVLTGFVIGMGAGFFHELLDSLSSIANKNNAAAG